MVGNTGLERIHGALNEYTALCAVLMNTPFQGWIIAFLGHIHVRKWYTLRTLTSHFSPLSLSHL